MRRLEDFYKKSGLENGEDLLGGKASGLYRLWDSGFKIPPTWVIPNISRVPTSNDRSLRDFAVQSVMPWSSNYNHFASHKFAVRSCGVDEDGAEMSFAGQHLTLLNVDGKDVRTAIKDCRASGKMGKRYKKAMTGKGGRVAPLSVLVQTMVPADTAGVMFTGNPATGDPDECVIEEVDGLGDKLVDGTVNPDRRYTFKTRGDQPAQTSGPTEIPSYINYLRSYSSKFAKILGRPADIEWAQCNGALYFLQLRALTGVEWEPTHLTGSSITNSKQRPFPNGFCPEVTGIVQRLPSLAPFKTGRILVTKMTTPHMIDEMVQSSGIITEIGGSTCHAAIVARELGKPCIVGCQEADELSSSMLVKMNAETGEVTNYGINIG